MKKNTILIFGLGLGIGILLCPLAVFVYVKSGMMPVTTADPPMPFEKFIARSAISVAIQKEENLKPSFVIAEPEIKNATRLYLNHCAGCHGSIDTPDSKMADAMFPKAPQLFKADDLVTDDPLGKIHWKIKNGLRLTGMPSYQKILSDEEIWQVSSLLQQADHLSELVKKELSAGMRK